MAFVIFSAGALTRSRTRTMSFGSFASLALGGAVLTLAAGFGLGYLLSSNQVAVAESGAESVMENIARIEAPQPATTDFHVDNRVLIDRFGELTGRMIQLEAEAFDLATRIGVIKDFEARLTPEELEAQAQGRVARTQPGDPSGGPLIPSEQDESELADPLAILDEMPESGFASPSDALASIEHDIERLAGLFEELDRAVASMNMAHMSFPGRQPVRGKAMTSSFGNRVDPFSKRRAFHSGVDYPAPTGTPIHASAGGKVIFAGYRPAYGNTVEIDHGAGLVTRYAHASKLLVKKGQAVMPGEKIARVGSTGRSTGPHLHFEILKDGRFVDPAVYLARF